jgi:peroxiredoxin Q/BCP
MLTSGTTAPDFTLPDENGDEVSLSELLIAGPIILYFYPADFTSGCTREACIIRDMHDDIHSVGLRVVGVSPQGGESHIAFREKHNLPFTLLSDPKKTVIKAYGVDGILGISVRRATFLIGESGEIEAAIRSDILINPHKDLIEKAIAARDKAAAKHRKSE